VTRCGFNLKENGRQSSEVAASAIAAISNPLPKLQIRCRNVGRHDIAARANTGRGHSGVSKWNGRGGRPTPLDGLPCAGRVASRESKVAGKYSSEPDNCLSRRYAGGGSGAPPDLAASAGYRNSPGRMPIHELSMCRPTSDAFRPRRVERLTGTMADICLLFVDPCHTGLSAARIPH
jgi:hypothetical protein